VVGGTAFVAGKAGAKAGAANAQPAAQQAPAAAAPPPDVASTAAPPTADSPPATESAGDKMDQLTKLKQLLDMDALTQDEFDAQKARILASM
jgi:hypothetical protein